MRKAFNFYRSYYEVAKQLTPKDRELFLMAILERQFEGKEPENLKGQVQFAYISQKHSIDSQVAGYQAKTGTTLGGSVGGSEGGSVQEKGKEQEEVEYTIDFKGLLSYINKQTGRQFRTINPQVKKKYKARLKEGYTKEDIIHAIDNAINNDYHKDNNFQYLTPEFFSRADKLDKYSQTVNNLPPIDKGMAFIAINASPDTLQGFLDKGYTMEQIKQAAQ